MPAGRRATAVAAILAGGLLLAGSACGERAEPVGAAEDLYPLTIESGDQPLVVEAPAERIALVDGAGGRILDALGAARRVVDYDVSLNALAGGLQPDIVVAPSTAEPQLLSKVAAAAHVPVYVTPDTSIREVERAITQLGLIVAEPRAARQLVRAIERQRHAVAARLGGTRRTRVFVDLGNGLTATNQSLIGDLVREARGRNVAGTMPAGVPVSVKQLLALDPDVYVTTTATAKQLRANRATARLRAVRTGRVLPIERWQLEPGPYIGRSLEAFAIALHPDVYR